MTIKEIIADAESQGITSGYSYPGFATLCRDDRRLLVLHFAKPVAKKVVETVATETMVEYLDRVAPNDDLPHRFAE